MCVCGIFFVQFENEKKNERRISKILLKYTHENDHIQVNNDNENSISNANSQSDDFDQKPKSRYSDVYFHRLDLHIVL